MRAAALVLAPLLIVAPLKAQSGLDGDGRIHGAPTLQVERAELHPGQVQTLNLHPRFHSVLEFPFPIARVDAGDDVFLASVVGNKLTLKATRMSHSETSMTVMLADADLTVVPFLVRADSTQPQNYVVRFGDPVEDRLREAEEAMAARLRDEAVERAAELAEANLLQRLMAAGETIPLRRTGEIALGGHGRLQVDLLEAQTVPGTDGDPHLYLRYEASNSSGARVDDLHFILRSTATRSRLLVLRKKTEWEIYDVQDVRQKEAIGPGETVRGILIAPLAAVMGGDQLDVEAVALNGDASVDFDSVLDLP